jgi:hypothetical protein
MPVEMAIGWPYRRMLQGRDLDPARDFIAKRARELISRIREMP